jgi:hypothetical protein
MMRKFVVGGFLGILLVAAGLMSVSFASAKVRLNDGGQLPFYARIEHSEVFHNDDWAVIVFYRQPGCVPEDFNLLDQFHFPSAGDMGAFECQPPTVEGFALWDNGPGIDPAPTQVKLQGAGAVPVWFIAWTQLQGLIADGDLTIGELEALDSEWLRKGTAASYSETIHPFQSNKNGLIQFVGKGMLEDGTRFFAQALFSFTSGGLKEIQIQFK